MKNKKLKIYITSSEGKISDSTNLLNKFKQGDFEFKSVVNNYTKVNNNKVPIVRGCLNKECFCTGDCREIIAWRDKLPNEY